MAFRKVLTDSVSRRVAVAKRDKTWMAGKKISADGKVSEAFLWSDLKNFSIVRSFCCAKMLLRPTDKITLCTFGWWGAVSYFR